jgi:hypothetical protein
MADLFTHASLAVLVRLGQRHPRGVATFVAGTCLPDLARVPAIGLTRARWDHPAIPEWLCYVWAPLHLPIGIAGVAYLGALLFPEPRRRWAFWNLFLGGLFHLLVDLMQTHLGLGYLLFFPFSEWDFELGWIGSETTVLWVPFLVPSTVAAAWWRWKRPR